MASSAGSVGELYRSLRSHRTDSAPVCLRALTTAGQDKRSESSRTALGSGQRPAYAPSLTAAVTSSSSGSHLDSLRYSVAFPVARGGDRACAGVAHRVEAGL